VFVVCVLVFVVCVLVFVVCVLVFVVCVLVFVVCVVWVMRITSCESRHVNHMFVFAILVLSRSLNPKT
jgi:hypothetical protein